MYTCTAVNNSLKEGDCKIFCSLKRKKKLLSSNFFHNKFICLGGVIILQKMPIHVIIWGGDEFMITDIRPRYETCTYVITTATVV